MNESVQVVFMINTGSHPFSSMINVKWSQTVCVHLQTVFVTSHQQVNTTCVSRLGSVFS